MRQETGIRGNGVAADLLDDVARRHHCRPTDDPCAVALVPAGVDGERVRDSLVPPGCGCIEVGTDHVWDANEDGIVVIVTTRTAFDMDLGSIFAEALSLRHWMPPRNEEGLRLALYEALGNALLHGNLELRSEDQTTPEAFLGQAQMLEQRLSEPTYGDRPAVLRARRTEQALEITLQDCGPGFATEVLPKNSGGHGIGMMEDHSDSMRFEDGGRRVILIFGFPVGGPHGH
jgi:anti-sigma regulatory factor (Ser/Thr protein kinase)